MSIDQEKIRHIAKLSRLSLTDEEVVLFSKQLTDIFSYVETLQEVNTDGIKETSQVTGLKNVFSDDEVEEIDEHMREKLLQQFPSREGDLLSVQKVFEE